MQLLPEPGAVLLQVLKGALGDGVQGLLGVELRLHGMQLPLQPLDLLGLLVPALPLAGAHLVHVLQELPAHVLHHPVDLLPVWWGADTSSVGCEVM